MHSTTLSAGDPVEARCTKCRKNNAHTIIAMAEEGPDKVQCSVCNREHKYRPPSVPKKPGVRSAALAQNAAQKQWEQLKPGIDSSKARAYTMNDAYKIDALISHPSFGLGVVQRVIGDRKIEILFESGLKTMRCK